MAYRNGTYVAFHAEDTSNPTESDRRYYELLKAMERADDDFTFINSHDKASSVRDSSKKETLRRSLLERLSKSRNFVLIVGKSTHLDDDWVPFEIIKAIDAYKLPIIAAYTDYTSILNVPSHRAEWPTALAGRIDNGTAKVIHIPFKKVALKAAIDQFDVNNMPGTSVTYYKREVYVRWGLIAP